MCSYDIEKKIYCVAELNKNRILPHFINSNLQIVHTEFDWS